MKVLILSASVLVLAARGCDCPDGMYPAGIGPDGKVVCRAEPVETPTPAPTPSPSPTVEPAPSPEATPTPSSTPQPEPGAPPTTLMPPPAAPSATPTPVEAPSTTPEVQVCGRVMPEKIIKAVGPPCPLGFVLVSSPREGWEVCVAASACGWRDGHPGPSPPKRGPNDKIRGNMNCAAEDIPGYTSDTWCWHFPERLRRGFGLRKGLLCEYDDPDAEQGCSDAYGRRVRDGVLISGTEGWDWHGWCPNQWAMPCPTPAPDPPGTPTPAVPGPSPEAPPTPTTCPWARIGLSGALSCQVRQGKLVCGGDTTEKFCPGNQNCNPGVPCDEGLTAPDYKVPHFVFHCGGRLCESPDSGPNALRLTFRASPGVQVEQQEENAYHVKIKAPGDTDGFWVEACLAPGNVSRAGDVLRLSGNPCSRREWTCAGAVCKGEK